MWFRDSCAICLDSLMPRLITLTLQEEHMQLNREEKKKDEPFKDNGGMEQDTCNKPGPRPIKNLTNSLLIKVSLL